MGFILDNIKVGKFYTAFDSRFGAIELFNRQKKPTSAINEFDPFLVLRHGVLNNGVICIKIMLLKEGTVGYLLLYENDVFYTKFKFYHLNKEEG